MPLGQLSAIDRAIGCLDQGLRVLFGPMPASERKNPAANVASPALDAPESILSSRLMRVNHSGEVCAQALYQGQALTARNPDVQQKLAKAADEENDHLAWTKIRLNELNSHTSRLNPLWYTGSFAIGAIAGLVGDRWSLGFLAETEHQVVDHLSGHLRRLPPNDAKSRAILEQMRTDESRHATTAVEAGGVTLPEPVRQLMRMMARVMTRTAYWI